MRCSFSSIIVVGLSMGLIQKHSFHLSFGACSTCDATQCNTCDMMACDMGGVLQIACLTPHREREGQRAYGSGRATTMAVKRGKHLV